MGSIKVVRNSNLEYILQPEGKERRAKAKTILLGITYGMGPTTLAERMDLSREESEKIIDDFYKGFPGVKKLTEDSQEMLRKKGYVTDMFGRRRHIPDAQLPEYEIKSEKKSFEFNPLLDSPQHLDRRTESLISDYNKKLSEVKWKKKEMLLLLRLKKMVYL